MCPALLCSSNTTVIHFVIGKVIPDNWNSHFDQQPLKLDPRHLHQCGCLPNGEEALLEQVNRQSGFHLVSFGPPREPRTLEQVEELVGNFNRSHVAFSVRASPFTDRPGGASPRRLYRSPIMWSALRSLQTPARARRCLFRRSRTLLGQPTDQDADSLLLPFHLLIVGPPAGHPAPGC